MKFGKQLQRQQVNEWSRYYMSYKGLKQIMKRALHIEGGGDEAVTATEAEVEDGTATFIYSMDRELEKVDAFFLRRWHELDRRVSLLTEKWSLYAAPTEEERHQQRRNWDDEQVERGLGGGGNPLEEFKIALRDVLQQLERLRAYTALNATGFGKILKKYDKRTNRSTRATVLTTKVFPRPFASGVILAELEDRARRLQAEVKAQAQLHRTSPPPPPQDAPHPSGGAAGLGSMDMAKLRACVDCDDGDGLTSTWASLSVPLTERAKIKALGLLAVRSCAFRSFAALKAILSLGLRPDLEAKEDVYERTLLHKLVLHGGSFPLPSGAPTAAPPRPGPLSYIPPLPSTHLYQNRPLHPNAAATSIGATYSPFTSGSGIGMALSPPSSGGSVESSPLPFSTAHPCADDTIEEDADGREDTVLISFVASYLPSVPPDIFGRHPLHYAALTGYARITRALCSVIRAEKEALNVGRREWCDREGYTPLFYAVLRGYAPVVRALLEEGGISTVDAFTEEELEEEAGTSIALPSWGAKIGDDRVVTLDMDKYLLEHPPTIHALSPLALACHLGHAKTAEVLLKAGADPSLADDEGSTPLHHAVRSGNLACVEILLRWRGEGSSTRKIDINAKESDAGWTPIFLAAMEGHTEITQALVSAGAKLRVHDTSGWSPHEHAVYRGHLDTALLLIPRPNPLPPTSPVPPAEVSTIEIVVEEEEGEDVMVDEEIRSVSEKAEEDDRDDEGVPPARISPPSSVRKPSKTTGSPKPSSKIKETGEDARVAERAYGHRYLQGTAMVVLTLGSVDCRRSQEDPVQLRGTEMQLAALMPGTALSLRVRADEEDGAVSVEGRDGQFLDLPLKEEGVDAIVIQVDEQVRELPVYFDLLPRYSGDEKAVGRATALIRTRGGDEEHPVGGDGRGSERGGWEDDVYGRRGVRVPVLSTKTMQVIGRILFEVLVIRPFVHRSVGIGARNTYWKSMTTKIIGHRGLGANKRVEGGGRAALQVGENTVLSFVTAASLGAEYVEFDVQLTRDNVPVIYHDWCVTETGLDIPVSGISSKQFLRLRPAASPRIEAEDPFSALGLFAQTGGMIPSISQTPEAGLDPGASSFPPKTEIGGITGGMPSGHRIARSSSLNAIRRANQEAKEREAKVLSARPLPPGKMKGNSYGTIQAPFTTLEETLRKVPSGIGFNIEVKYPMPDEAEEDELRPINMGGFVDRILQVVYDHVGERNVLFSSFHPDVCRLLSIKQPNYPVFFLTDAGTSPVADIRCQSLSGAVQFARDANLMGIVSHCPPFLEAPRLVKAIRESGLLVFTYGALNNDVANAQLQRQAGVDAVIVDSVLAVRKGLHE